MMTRRKFIIGAGTLLFAFLAPAGLCPDDQERADRRTERRNKKLKRKGKDKAKPGDGKGWGDECDWPCWD